MQCVRWLKEIKNIIFKGMLWLEANMQINKVDFFKTKKMPLMIIILPNEVNGDG